MRKTKVQSDEGTRYLNLEAAKKYLSVGRNSVERIAAEAGARRKIGTRVVYDRVLMDEYLLKQREVQ